IRCLGYILLQDPVHFVEAEISNDLTVWASNSLFAAPRVVSKRGGLARVVNRTWTIPLIVNRVGPMTKRIGDPSYIAGAVVGVTGDVPELIHFAYQRTIAVKVVAVDDRVPLTIHRIRRQRGHQHLAAIVVGPVGRIPKGIKYAVYPPMPFIEILNGGIASG